MTTFNAGFKTGACQACGDTAKLLVDLKRVRLRGHICERCSSILSLAADDPLVLRRLVAYLEGEQPE
jgi:hypothetical protein